MHRILKKIQKKFLLLLFAIGAIFILAPQHADAAGISFGDSIAAVIFTAPLYLYKLISREIISFLGNIINEIITYILNSRTTITTDPILLSFWNISKNWANMLIVVALIGIAIATILRFRDYEAKKLLPGIIVVALLVNFSVVFVGFFIDVSDKIMREFLNTTESSPEVMLDLVIRVDDKAREVASNNLWGTSYGPSGWTKLFENILTVVAIDGQFIIIYTVLLITFIVFAFLLIVRFGVLALLFVLSPLVFVFYVFPFPKSKELFNEWWQTFIKWCFVGVGGGFCMRIAKEMFEALNNASTIPTNGNQSSLLIVRILIPTILLLVGLKITAKAAPKFASAVTGIAKSAGIAIATGGASLAGNVVRVISNKSGATDQLKKAKDALTDNPALNWTRDAIYGTGASDTVRNKRNEARLKPVREQMKDIKDVNVLVERAQNGTAAESAVAAEMLAKQNALGAIKNKPMRDKIVQSAINSGATEITKTNADYAHLDKEKKIQLMALHAEKGIGQEDKFKEFSKDAKYAGMSNKRVNELAYESRIEDMMRNDVYIRQTDNTGKMNSKDMTARLKEKGLTPGAQLNSDDAQMFERLIERGDEEDLKKAWGKETFMQYADEIETTHGARIKKDAMSRDHLLAGFDERGALLEVKKDYIRETHPSITDEAEVEELARGTVTDKAFQEKSIQTAAEKIGAETAATKLSGDTLRDWTRRNASNNPRVVRQALNSRNIRSDKARLIKEGLMDVPEAFDEFEDKEIVKILQAEPRYTKEEMEKAESALGATANDAAKNVWVRENHESKLKHIMSGFDQKTLESVIEKASNDLQAAMAKVIVKNVADNAATITNEELTEKLSAIPTPHMAGAINALPTALPLRADLKNKLLRRGADTITEREATPEEIEKSKTNREKDMLSLRTRGLMPNEGAIRVENDKLKSMGSPTLTLEDFYQRAINERKRQRILDEASSVPRSGVALQDDVAQLRKGGFMLSEEEIVVAGISPEIEYKRAIEKRNAKVKVQIEKEEKPKTLLKRTDKVPLKPEELKDAEQYFNNPELETHWQSLDKEKQEKLEEFLKGL